MISVCHIQVNDGQRHKDECLQRDNQDVEYSPYELQGATEDTHYPARAVHQRDQDEDHFTRVHVAEQTQ